MDHDDPEQRISELERQLAAPRESGSPVTGGLSAAYVHTVAFSKPPIGKRGYNEDEVDAFLNLVAEHLGSGTGAPPQAGGLPSARHGGTRHGTGETWPRRILNAVTHFVAWMLD
jgi:DivIVA domain-containing protein